MSDRNAEGRHDRITNELVQHAAFMLDAIHHQREIFVEQSDGPLSAQLLGNCGEATDI